MAAMDRMRQLLYSATGMMLVPMHCLSAPSGDAGSAGAPIGPSPLSGTELLSMSMNLLLVIVAILVLGWLYTRSQGLKSSRDGHFRVLAAQPLGAKEKVILLQVGEQQVVVGVSPNGMSTLLVPDKPIVVESGMGEAGAQTFTERLRSAVARSRP